MAVSASRLETPPPRALGKVLYGALFVVVVPALLVSWARATRDVVKLPAIHSLPIGLAVAVASSLVMVLGWFALFHFGGGLPMNAFPPPRFVAKGAYRWLPHPIYAGFCGVCGGVSIACGSSSGLWLITPTMVLGCIALVVGHERHDLRARFGERADTESAIALCRDEPTPPTLGERLALFPLVLFPWALGYEAVALIGRPIDARVATFAFEARLPVWEWAELIYASTYVLVLAAPFVARTRRDLRRLGRDAIFCMAIAFPLYLVIPLVSPPRPFTPHGPLGAMLMQERAWDTEAAAFPSFHVLWALLSTDALASRLPRLRLFFRAIALAIAGSCLATGMHAVVDVAFAFVVYALVRNASSIWGATRSLTERIANSWRETRIGGVRIINHGLYGGLATFGGLSIVGSLIGAGKAWPIVIAASCGLVGSALFAQYVEGSPALLRPYGFYGGLLGVIVGTFAAPLFGVSIWLLCAAYCVAGPFVQSMGRLRCLVQGCCHGAESSPAVGICYTHPRSRVVRLTALAGVPLHATPLYSILWNVVVALVVGRLWSLHVPLHFVAGIYLLLSGLGRFVEESYRGEPQTKVIAGLRLYQWVALSSIVSGATITAIGSSAPAPTPSFDPVSMLAALGFGAFTFVALGVDFPDSTRRFSRLC